MLELLGEYVTPDHIQGTVITIIALLGALGAGLMTQAKWSVIKRTATKEVDDENDGIRDTTVKLLREQNEVIIEQNVLLKYNNADLEQKNGEFQESVRYLTVSIVNLNGKVDNLTHWFEALACLNAPGCDRRNCPNRLVIAKMVAGEVNLDEVYSAGEEV